MNVIYLSQLQPKKLQDGRRQVKFLPLLKGNTLMSKERQRKLLFFTRDAGRKVYVVTFDDFTTEEIPFGEKT
jgi:hypothetical protein